MHATWTQEQVCINRDADRKRVEVTVIVLLIVIMITDSHNG